MTDRVRSAEIVDGVVTRVIVGPPGWARRRLGGFWVALPVGKKAAPGWVHIKGKVEPPPPEPGLDD